MHWKLNTSRNAARHLIKLQHCHMHMYTHTINTQTHIHTNTLAAYTLQHKAISKAISGPGYTCGCLQKWHAMWCTDKLDTIQARGGRLANLASIWLLYIHTQETTSNGPYSLSVISPLSQLATGRGDQHRPRPSP